MNLFNSVESINWNRLWWVVGILVAFWSGMAGVTILVPAFDIWYKVINIILSAVFGALLFAARGTVYVRDRTQVPPADGKT